MAQPSKIVTAATQVLNKFAPFADRCIACLPFTETSEPGGTGFANIGHGTTYGGAYAYANGTTIAAGTGALTFGSDGLRTTYVQTLAGTTDRAAIRALPNGDASNGTYADGSLLIDFKDPGATPGAGTKRYFVYTGSASSTFAGVLAVYRDENDNLKIDVGNAASGDIITFSSSQITWANWQTLLLCWHNGTLTAYLNRSSSTVTANGGSKSVALTAGYINIVGSRYLTLGGFNQSASGLTYTVRYSMLAMWDMALNKFPQSLKHINRLLSDPWLIARPFPDEEGILSTNVNAATAKVTATTAELSVVTGLGDTGALGGELSSANVGFRFLWGASNDPTSANHCNNTATSSITSTLGAMLNQLKVSLSGLTAGTTYYGRPEYTDDNGTTWHPMPGGLQRFTTQRTDESDFDIGFMSDDHLGNSTDNPGFPSSANLSFGAVNYNAAGLRKLYALERAIQFAVLYNNYDFHVHLGDWYMPDQTPVSVQATIAERNSELAYLIARRAAQWRNFCHELFADGMVLFIGGNHESEAGYMQPTSSPNFPQACQAISTTIRKLFFPCPDNSTYPEGGENEGDPAADNVTWVPDVSQGVFAAYDASPLLSGVDYMTDFVNGPEADFAGLNKSPLENYYALKWGGGSRATLLIFGDIHRYTEVGDPGSNVGSGGNDFRTAGAWTFGDVQLAWIEQVARASTARNKFFFSHSRPSTSLTGYTGGASAYCRGSGLFEDDPKYLYLYNLFVSLGFNGWGEGHDHKAFHGWNLALGGKLNLFTIPTPSAPSHTSAGGVGGWNYAELEAYYGTAESDGADLAALGDGLGTAAGIKSLSNVLGVANIAVGNNGPSLRFVRTEISRGDDGTSLNQTPTHYERNLGALKTAASDVATLDLTPREVVDAYLAADIIRDRDDADPFWSTVPTSKKGSAVGQYPYDEDRVSAAVVLEASVDNQAVYVMAVPMVMYEAELNRAVPLQIGQQPVGGRPYGFDPVSYRPVNYRP